MIRISIITPTLNAITTVKETLESVKQQTHTSIEHIALDAGSTDGTLEYLRSQSEHLSQLIAEPDDGIAHAFNKGISAATGEYIMFLNADDYLRPEILSEIETYIESHHHPDVVYGAIEYLDGALTYTERPNLRRIWCYMSIFHPATLVRRDAFERIGCFSRNYQLAMDSEWFHRALAADLRFAEFPGIIATMRTGGVSHKNLYAALREFRKSAQTHGRLFFRPWIYFFRQYAIQRLLKIDAIKRLNLARR